MENLLQINHLTIQVAEQDQAISVVDNVSIGIPKGKTIGLVGESGSGKSLTAMSILRLLPKESVRVSEGEILFEGRDLSKLSNREFRNIRGGKISMIFQEPMTALNPIMTIENQILEIILRHQDIKKKEAKNRVVQLLKEVGISAPEIVAKSYPHQLSGGMRQRVMIAIAIASKPQLIIADEPTTALDVTIQAQILLLLKKIQQQGTSLLLITHDFGVVSQMCDEIYVMYAGRIVEQGNTKEVLHNPKHPYTKALLKSIPQIHHSNEKLHSIEGTVPTPSQFPQGCRFAPRCPYKIDLCSKINPALLDYENTKCACHVIEQGVEIL